MAGWINMVLCTEVGLGPGDIVLDGDPNTPKMDTVPPLLAHTYCGQTAGWIKMPLGAEVDLGSGHIVSDGPSSLRKGPQQPLPLFSTHVCCGQTVATAEPLLEEILFRN